MMCGCEICILVKGMQNDLNAYRLLLLRKFESKNGSRAKTKAKAYKKYVYNNDEHLHVHPKKVLLCIQCPPIENFNVPHMGCIIRTCEKCPKYKMNKYEKLFKKMIQKLLFMISL